MLMRSTISALPTTNPMPPAGHPVRLRHRPHLDAASFAPGVARKLSGARPSKTRSMYAASWTIAVPVRWAYATAASNEPGRRADRARVRRVVQVQRRGRRRGVEIGRPRRLPGRAGRARARLPRARRPRGSRGSTGRAAGSSRPAFGERHRRARRSRSSCPARARPRARDRARRRRRRGSGGDRLAQPPEPAERRVSVDVRPCGRLARARRRRVRAARPRGCRARGRSAAARRSPPRPRPARAASRSTAEAAARAARADRAPCDRTRLAGRRAVVAVDAS